MNCKLSSTCRLRETECEGAKWIELAQNSSNSMLFINMETNHRVQQG
jgi:hypothetical protein